MHAKRIECAAFEKACSCRKKLNYFDSICTFYEALFGEKMIYFLACDFCAYLWHNILMYKSDRTEKEFTQTKPIGLCNLGFLRFLP